MAEPGDLRALAGDRVEDVLSPYLGVDRRPDADRPWVLANMVAGLDGSAAVGGKVGALSSPRDTQLFKRLRSLADVVLVGAETARRERYGPVALDDDLVERRRRAGQQPPRLAIVSSSLRLDLDLPLFTRATAEAPPIVITTTRSDPSQLSSSPVEVVTAGDERVDLAVALRSLRDRSAEVVLCEGGPTLLGQLVAADLLDEYCLTISPLVGGDPLPIIDTEPVRQLTRFRLRHAFTEESTVFLDYLRERDS